MDLFLGLCRIHGLLIGVHQELGLVGATKSTVPIG
jgi:hypothetical protein